MLHVSGVSDLVTDAARPPEDQKLEVFCNHVAAAALMPKDTLLADPIVVAQGARSVNWSNAEVQELARQFDVSREALLHGLDVQQDYGLISKETEAIPHQMRS